MTQTSESASAYPWCSSPWSLLRSSLRSSWWVSFWCILAFPIAVLSHEAAHFTAYRIYDFPQAQLHYGSASFEGGSEFWKFARAGEWQAAAAIAEPFQVGVASAAGIVASWLVMLLCACLAPGWPHPFVLALGFISSLRFLGSVFILALSKLGRNGSDEEHVALLFSQSEGLLHLLGIVTMLATWYVLYRAAAPENRLAKTGQIILGTVIGGVLYIGVLGPLFLP